MSPARAGIMSPARIASLLASILVSLASGTNYVYSAYAPQMGSRLHISHTKLNIIGLAGNVGVYSTAPFFGRLVDTRGPRMLLAAAFVLLLSGYWGIRSFFTGGVEDTLSTFNFCLLVLCGFMTGAGGNAGLVTSVNAAAVSFPDNARATTTGLVISGFGLSALFFSTIAHAFMPGDTPALLALLAFGTSLPMVVGFFLVRPLPLPPSDPAHVLEHGHPPGARRGSRTALLGDDDARSPLIHHAHGHAHGEDDEDAVAKDPPLEMRPSPSVSPTRLPGPARRKRSTGHLMRVAMPVNVRGLQMFMSKEFALLFCIMSLLSGTGLMWINNVGSVSQALFAKGDPDFDEVVSAKWQATQVSTVSFMNFLGRILIGLLSDFTKNTLRRPRSYCVCVVAALFILSQVIAASVTSVQHLWVASAALGLAYGSLFGVYPTVVIEAFGLRHFSENWGCISLSPLIGGNLFSIAFGRNLDAHAAPEEDEAETALRRAGEVVRTVGAQLARRAGLPSTHQCFDGRECYIASLTMTTGACVLALALSGVAAWRDRRKQLRAEADVARGEGEGEVLWEEEEDE